MSLEELQFGKYLGDFEMVKLKKVTTGDPDLYEEEIRVEFREREDRCPRKGLLKNGYQSPIEVIDHTIGGYPTFLKFYRRRWKELEEDEEDNICNHYNLAIKGTKLTPSFGNF